MKLRALEPEDLNFLYTVENDMSNWQYGINTALLSRFKLREYIANSQADIYKDEQVRMILVDDEGNSIGIADVFNFSPLHNRAEIGLYITPENRGIGNGQKALALLADYCRHIHLHQLYCVVDITNSSSLAMLTHFGFQSRSTLTSWLSTPAGYHDALLLQYFL